jgi:hypothetical protein
VLLLTIDVTNNTTARIELVKTGLLVGGGAGGVVTLVLAGRRQWSNEQVARITEHDATERRITELYTKAAEQLGSDKAPVRLAGLYALERLAQDNPTQRQTIVNVLCAYLRMPYDLPGKPPSGDATDMLAAMHREKVQEREVRLTAQAILATHLRPGDNPTQPISTFWPDTDLQLGGAMLIGFTLTECHVRVAIFAAAKFVGRASFVDSQFTDVASFERAVFNDGVEFMDVQFHRVSFSKAQFQALADFHSAAFIDTNAYGGASFSGAAFTGGALFEESRFGGTADFSNVHFANADPDGGACFAGMRFDGLTLFRGVQFDAAPNFERVHGAGFRDGQLDGLIQ